MLEDSWIAILVEELNWRYWLEHNGKEVDYEKLYGDPTVKHIPDPHCYNSGRLSNNPFAGNKDGLD